MLFLNFLQTIIFALGIGIHGCFAYPPRIVAMQEFNSYDPTNSMLVIPKKLEQFAMVVPEIRCCFNQSEFVANMNAWSLARRAKQGIYPLDDCKTLILHGMEYNAKQNAESGIKGLSKHFSTIAVVDDVCNVPDLLSEYQKPMSTFVVINPELICSFLDRLKRVDVVEGSKVCCAPSEKKLFLQKDHKVFSMPKEEQYHNLVGQIRHYHVQSCMESCIRMIAGHIPCNGQYGYKIELPKPVVKKIGEYLFNS